ncbi:isochorismatase family protein [Streptomyces sp. BH-SS-21]|uniref:Isochorismatase family protein n=1 Tax=Streptomyces liliiviolaceus TaxID=2823109 RepID=A0A940XZE4_9ACTN|nr:isochorismatase family protein [Streptomyces liliiviolaceus]MBQ0850492.1 isochorismatase family protein [Streptomyces liliiviolaceus]
MTAPAIPEISSYPMPTAAELPENTASWTVDPRRALLLVHDMQHFFLRPFPAGRSPVTDLVDNVTRLREAAVAAGVPVAYTAQPGDMTDEQRGLLKDFWGPGMSGDPAQRGVPEQLAPGPDDTVLVKWRPSAFFRTPLLDLLREQGRDQLVLCGVYAHVGILQTACEAFAHDIQTFLVADAVADFSAADHRMAVAYAAGRCSMVVPTATVSNALGAVVTGGAR